MTSLSQNGWPVIHPNQQTGPKLRTFTIPGTGVSLPLRDGSAGFLIAHYMLWYHETIEPINVGQRDEWGYAYKAIRDTGVWSNHASGTAADVNAVTHPYGRRNTFPYKVRIRIRMRLNRVYRGCLRSGIFYRNTADDMHIEIDKTLAECETRARSLMRSARGKRILADNPGLDKVILS